jgi:hypothetical protein
MVKRRKDVELASESEDVFSVDEFQEAEYTAALERRVASYRVEREARRLVATEEASRTWRSPTDDGLLGAQLRVPRETPRYLAERLMGWNHNVVLAAQFKTGKTTFGLNFARCAVDGLPFLGREVQLPDGCRIGWWNGEMERDDFLDYARPLRIKQSNDILPLHLRGHRMPLMDDIVAEWTVKWLREHDIAIWVMDSWRRLVAWSGANENKNEEVEPLTDRIDQIKRESGCQAFLTLAHTGRTKAEEGEEHARGATALDDWVDARWLLTKQPIKDGDTRFLFAEGRGVEFAETALEFDRARNRLLLGKGDRRTAVSDALRDRAVAVVVARPGLFTGKLQVELGVKGNNDKVTRALRSAETARLVHHRDKASGRGRSWYPGEAPDDTECTCDWGR